MPGTKWGGQLFAVLCLFVVCGCNDEKSNSEAKKSSKPADPIKAMGAKLEVDMRGKIQAVRFNEIAVKDTDLDALSRYASLEQVFLDSDKITDEGLSRLTRLPELTLISIHNAKLTNEGLADLTTLEHLDTLSLAGCAGISDAGAEHIAKLTSLRELDLSGTQVTGSGLKVLTALSNLDTLILDDTQLDDAGLAPLKSFTKLHKLSLMGVKLGVEGMGHIAQVKSLVQLLLHRCSLSNEALRPLGGMPNLVRLELNDNKALDDAGIEYLKTLPKLTSLVLTGTNVTGDVFAEPKLLKGLWTLVMIGTPMSDRQAPYVAQLRQLKSLRLGDSKVTDAGAAVIKRAIGDPVSIEQ